MKVYRELDQSLCVLNSLGNILTELTLPDRDLPDLTSLADLGRVIAKEAMTALDLVHHLQETNQQACRPGENGS